MLADGQATLEVLAQIAPACQPQAIYCQMGTIGLPETQQAIAFAAGASAGDDLRRCSGFRDQSPGGEGADPGARQRGA